MTLEIPVAEFTPDPDKRIRAISVIVYDMQGGPFPTKAMREIELVAERVADQYGLAISISKE